jgi:hypothetical protein
MDSTRFIDARVEKLVDVVCPMEKLAVAVPPDEMPLPQPVEKTQTAIERATDRPDCWKNRFDVESRLIWITLWNRRKRKGPT